jgi:uracil-DNA glycosylase
LQLRRVFITAPCHCAPPDNKPTLDELGQCRSWFVDELKLLPRARVFLALGKIGYDAVLGLAKQTKAGAGLKPPAFAHGISTEIPDPRDTGEVAWLVASYHVSQQNTQTGRLTEDMFDAVLAKALSLAE